ncbi:hypothetical protein WMF28_33555 [Sorangium sp. So ce590]|uniref:hypothetical protein n=1 Tax=Sorangium sp. So ce590 TaxID=3133317 RepID=UPI003F628734
MSSRRSPRPGQLQLLVLEGDLREQNRAVVRLPDVIGVAYLDEDQLTLEGVTIKTGRPGKGGTLWNHEDSTTVGESGEVHETLRFPE